MAVSIVVLLIYRNMVVIILAFFVNIKLEFNFFIL